MLGSHTPCSSLLRFSFSLPAYVYRVERGTFQWAYWWLGRIYVLYCILHGSILGIVARNTSFGAPPRYPTPGT
jgi:hypothetical protein